MINGRQSAARIRSGRRGILRTLLGAIALAIVCGLIVGRVSAQTPQGSASTGQLDVLPFPGTPDASPLTQINFPALSPAQVLGVKVRGSLSGLHTGRLLALAAHGGTAFILRRPFLDGDRVSVRARLSSGSAGSASGAPDATVLSFGFSVAAPLPEPSVTRAAAMTSRRPALRPSFNPATFTHSFHSASWMHAPILSARGKLPDPGEGDIFVSVQNSIQAGPAIFDPTGRLLWFHPMRHTPAFNVEVQSYKDQSVLTFFKGTVILGYGEGEDVILNHSYQTIATIRGAQGLRPDLHEFQITRNGNALITTHQLVNADLRAVGGPSNGTLIDGVIQEINIATGQLLWEWHAYGHVPVGDSYAGTPGTIPYDFIHINSIQQLPNGNLLVSARHTWAVYEISRRTGKLLWQLGGKHSSFNVGPGANFEFQHDAHMQPDGTITVFDNGDGLTQSESQSRALRIRLHMKSRQATLVHAYTNRPPALSMNQGSVQALRDGNVFVGWGGARYFTEFTSHGRQLFSERFSGPVRSYRAYRVPWTGQPESLPSIAVSPTQSGVTVYASWNGATDVASWRVLAGARPHLLSVVAQREINGFETGISADTTQPYLAVQALNAGGQVMATSQTVTR